MLTAWTVMFVALAYVGVLFAVASYGDRAARTRVRGTPRPLIFALSLGVYCTSWTFFGSVGLAARSGFDFLPIYIGPILVLALGWPALMRLVELAKKHNITSIADFISARYGKNQLLGALVAGIAIIGVIPYISLQLKAVSFSLHTMMPPDAQATFPVQALGADLAVLVTVAMACFAILFGTRHIDTTEHQDGLILAIAVESVVKLFAFLAVGACVTWWMMGGITPLVEAAQARPEMWEFSGGRFLTMTVLSMFAILLLPRQFHVMVVENSNLSDLRRAAWLFPLYLVAINLFVIPVAMAGLLMLGTDGVDADTYVLALPVEAGYRLIAVVTFIGGLSAATAMVIVETVALSIMACNNIVVPVLLRRRGHDDHAPADMGSQLLLIRRLAICIVLVLAYSYYRMIGNSAQLAQTGLLSFAAVAQFAPALFLGLMWRRVTAAGAMAGLVAGFGVWAYCLLMPSFADAGWISQALIDQGPWGVEALRPRILFNLNFDPLTNGVLWSLVANTAALIGVSLLSRPTPIERLQAAAFVPADAPAPPGLRMFRTSVTVGQLEATVARYLGEERAQRSFEEFAAQRGQVLDRHAEADVRLVRYAEHLLASAVGAASSRLVLALLLERHSANSRGAMRLLDDASDAIQYNRDLLQSAIDHVRQGIAVFDRNLNLICWNRQFRHLLQIPPDLGRVGVPLDEVMRTILAHADLAGEDRNAALERRVAAFVESREPYQERIGGSVIEVRSTPMPDGGVAATFADITERVLAAEALQRANETLERRVEERTAALTEVNRELERAKAEAEAANLGKTRFIAAASHDILQPLNAARLFTSSLVERRGQAAEGELVRNVDRSLEAVEEILTALLDISRLDAGAVRPDITRFPIGDLFDALALEFAPLAQEKGLALVVVPSSLTVASDRRMLRRVLQNLLSNAIKYTDRGKVLMGCRRAGGQLRIEVHDTGPGIPADKRRAVFLEFERLNRDGGRTSGLGLGLSIVERMARTLGHPLELRSGPGGGSTFSITVPLAPAAARPAAAPPGLSPSLDFRGQRVLVIDNEQSIIDGMTALLTGWGCSVAQALDAAAARDAIASGPVGVILADYHLGAGDGLDLIAALRREAGWRVPAVLITADRSRIVQTRASAMDVVYLRKPVRPAALRASMAHVLARPEAAE